MKLETEIRKFEAIQSDLERDHNNEWVLIKDEDFIGAFSSFELAAAEALDKFDDGPYLIRKVGGETVDLPLFALATL